MKSLMKLLQAALLDCKAKCGTTTTRDFETISSRVEHEGLSFLTITLGDFASDFERSLELGHIGHGSFRSFGKNGSIPKLFSGMIRQVFDDNGRLLPRPSVTAILCIRQVCRMFKKIELPCTGERELAAIGNYKEVEEELLDWELTFDTVAFDNFGTVSDVIWSSGLYSLTESIVSGSLIPNHGPGVTAVKVLPNQKYNWQQWHSRLEPYFPSDSFCYANSSAFSEECDRIAFLSPEEEPPVRVVFVPKTLKAPRVIAIEPACMQYTQQSLMQPLVDCIEQMPLTKGHLNFTNQSVNRSLALSSSRDGKFATLDLKDASDRVSRILVYRMLRSNPILRDAIFACRSTSAKLPDGVTLHISKFASMGSALCFPIESMVFFTILVYSELKRLGLPCRRWAIELVRQSIYVYGDDLIIPVDGVPAAITALETFGLKVSASKSFSRGKFRESCGLDAYDGVEVTPSYIRRMPPSSSRDSAGIVSMIKLSNQLYNAGFFNFCQAIEDHIRSISRYEIPIVSDTASCIGYVRFDKPLTVTKWCKYLHIPLVKGYVPYIKEQNDPISGHSAFMKWSLKGLNPKKDHLLRSAGSGRLTLKVRWCRNQ